MKLLLPRAAWILWTVLLLVLAGGATALVAQPVISNVVVDSISDTTVRIRWEIDGPSTGWNAYGWVAYGTSPTSLDYTTSRRGDTPPGVIYRGTQIAGLKPDTVYYFRPMNLNQAGQVADNWACSAPGPQQGYTCATAGEVPSFRTLPAAANWDPAPVLTFETPMPIINGQTFAVASNCANLESQLAAAANADSSRNHQVVIPAGTNCLVVDSLILPKKVGSNWVVVRTSTPDSQLPPPGTRVTPSDAPKLATITKLQEGLRDDSQLLRSFSSCNYYDGICNPQGACGAPYCSRGWRFVGLEFTTVKSTGHLSSPIANVTASPNGGGTNFTVTTAGPHGLTFFQVVQTAGIQGFFGSDPNQMASVSVYSPNTFQYYAPGNASGSYQAGTGYWAHYFSLPIADVRPGSPIVVKTADRHALKSGYLVRIQGVQGITGANGGHVITVLSETEFSLNDSSGEGIYTPGTGEMANDPAQYLGLISFHADSADMYLDRCWIHGQGFPTRISFGVALKGERNAIVDSTIDNINAWRTTNNANGGLHGGLFGGSIATAVAVDLSFGGPHKLVNNTINAEGIILFATDAAPVFDPPHDVEIRRNYVMANPQHLYAGRDSDGLYYPHRHWFEAKKGQRFLFDANVFEHCWADFGQPNGACLMFTPRVGSVPVPSMSKARISDITWTNNILRNTSGAWTFFGGEQIGTGDLPTSTRILVRNNLVHDLDYFRWRTPGTFSPAAGVLFNLSGGDKIVIDHNTMFDTRGSAAAILANYHNRGSNLRIQNNIFTHNHDSNYSGYFRDVLGEVAPVIDTSSAFNSFRAFWQAVPDADPQSTFSYNLIIPGVKNSQSDQCYVNPGADCDFSVSDAQWFWNGFTRLYFPPGNTARDRIGSILFAKPLEGNFRLSLLSPFRGSSQCSGSPCSTDGKDLGVDMDQIESSMKTATNVQVRDVTANRAIFSYDAPDSVACRVEAAPDPLFYTARSKFDTGGFGKRNTTLEGLQELTAYYYRVVCGGGETRGTFKTLKGQTAEIATTVEVAPLPYRGVARASLEYGSSLLLGAETPAATCGSRCLVTLPATKSNETIFRLKFFDYNDVAAVPPATFRISR